MAKHKNRCESESKHHIFCPQPLSSVSKKAITKGNKKKRRAKNSEKKEWDAVTCSVCLEFPHNAVLLLCSSYHKGCRPYMCATSNRFSNCLKQYQKAYTKVTSKEVQPSMDIVGLDGSLGDESTEVSELLCPLCRGQVKGWTVVEATRKYLNSKRRACMQDKCLFSGTYKELRKHVKAKHPLAQPRAVDPVLKEKWKQLEGERERSDVISTIMSSTPGALVLGDYVIEPFNNIFGDGFDSVDFLDDGVLNSRSRLHHYDFGMRRVAPWTSAGQGPNLRQRILLARRRWLRGPNADR